MNRLEELAKKGFELVKKGFKDPWGKGAYIGLAFLGSYGGYVTYSKKSIGMAVGLVLTLSSGITGLIYSSYLQEKTQQSARDTKIKKVE